MAERTVVSVTPHQKNPEWRVVSVGTETEGEAYVVFAGKLADDLVVGKPLPQGTTEEPPKFDGALPSLRLPRPGGGTAWRNTKEGFEAEAAGRQRWQQIEEERRDRRTALMQALQRCGQLVSELPKSDVSVLSIADVYYEWLRTSPAAGPPAESRGMAPSDGVATKGEGEGHSVREPSPSPAGGTTSAEGEAAVDAGPGEQPTKTESSPGSAPKYPVAEETCDHKSQAGHWLPTRSVKGVARCPRCGANAVIYRESA